MDSTTAPSATNDTTLYSRKKCTAHIGFSACRTSGLAIILRKPSAARIRNQASIIGANSLPTSPVPCFCMANSNVSTIIASGTTHVSSCGATISSPSMADITEIAGVITTSP